MDGREFEQAQRRAKALHDRQNHVRPFSTLGFYVQKGRNYTLEQRHPGDGSGVPQNHIRFIIQFEAPLFWRTFAELKERAGRRRHRAR